MYSAYVELVLNKKKHACRILYNLIRSVPHVGAFSIITDLMSSPFHLFSRRCSNLLNKCASLEIVAESFSFVCLILAAEDFIKPAISMIMNKYIAGFNTGIMT